ncbi:MAG: DAK2 domain-containing protein [Dehalococcoidia bacterium]
MAVESLSGGRLRDTFAAAAAWLERNADAVNAINVFPVPDGDTGTNMHLTMRSLLEEASRCSNDGAGDILAAMSRGALMGARGNSGVILSQIVRGLAAAAQGTNVVTAAGLVRGLEEGSAQAYKAVTQPVEGTILTVMREVAAAAAGAQPKCRRDIICLLDAAVAAAHKAVANTPSLLPALAEAGVVDAGGQGLLIILDGMARYLRGEPMELAAAVPEETVAQDWLTVTQQIHGQEESLYGYCTEFLVGGSRLHPDRLRQRMLELGDSVLVVGDERLVRVHLHTDDPGAALSHGTKAGSLHGVKVDNIREQAERFLERHEEGAEAEVSPPQAIAAVAVASGDGLAEVFRSVGASRVVAGGPTMNPSTRDILAAIDACPADRVVVLPNDKNIVMAARQAAELSENEVWVVATTSIPQGIAALLSLSQEQDMDANLQAMEEARRTVRTIEVSRAVRGTSVKGVKVRRGQAIAIVDDELKLAADDPREALRGALATLPMEEASLITLYYGADSSEAEAEALAEKLREAYPRHEVEVVRGGQPHYHYIASLE